MTAAFVHVYQFEPSKFLQMLFCYGRSAQGLEADALDN